MKQLLFILALLINTTFCLAQKNTLNLGSPQSSGYYEELPYLDINGKLLVTVEIAGVKHLFLFDTGAPVMLNDQLASALNAPELYNDTIVDVNGGKSLTTAIKVDIKLGSTLFAGVAAIKGLPPGLLSCWKIDGVLGSNLLRNSIVKIDGKKHLIIITDQKNKLDLKNANSTKLITTHSVQSTPYVSMLIGGKINLIIEFDSGDNHLLRLTEELTNKMKGDNVFQVIATGYGSSTFGVMGAQKNAEKLKIKIPRMTIGAAEFKNTITETNKTGIPGMGTDLLKYGNVTLDFIHGKFYFDADSVVTDLNMKSWPVTPSIVDSKLIVGVVWDKFIDQLKPGEQIIAINDLDYSHVELCDLINKESTLAGKETAVLTIKDKDGNLRKVKIDKQ